MSPSNLFRMGGLAAVGAGVLTIIGELVGLGVYFEDMAVAATTFSYALTFWLYMLGSVLLLGGWSLCTSTSPRRRASWGWWDSW